MPRPKEPHAKTAAASRPRGRTLGPVVDLERHLPADWWRSLFNALYLKTDGDVVENAANTRAEIDLLIDAAGLRQSDHVLDLCCGPGRHALELARRGYAHICGVDRSRYLVRLARRRARQAGLPVSFREGDARRLRLPAESMQCVFILGNSFGYFEQEEDDRAVLDAVTRVLAPSGVLAMDLADGAWISEHFEPRSWEWIDQNHFVCRERSLDATGRRLISREVVTHAERGVIVDQFYAERLYTWQDIESALEAAGFEEVCRHAVLTPHSERNQDLGMMAHRMFLTARKPSRKAPAVKAGPLFAEITVLLGDPSLPDDVKLNGVFNAEDMATIARMQEALGGLDGYTFSYLDSHAGLLDALTRQRPGFVFNLCDEGFMNDAFRELHIPALLELLGIAYSGAGPAALALCYNKAHVRAIAHAMDIPTPLETYCGPEDNAATLPSVFPALLKPNFGDSSIGITAEAVVDSTEQFVAYWQQLRREFPGRPVLVQEFLSGNEYSVGVVGNPGFATTVLPVLEVDYSGLPEGLPRILGYESKWRPDSPYWSDIRYKQAELPSEEQQRLVDYSNALFERLGCRDYARFDFRADSRGKIKLLEANPNPGWCWDGKMNIMAGMAGMSYGELLRGIIEAAQERHASTR